MSDRATILARLRATSPAPADLPELVGDWLAYDNRVGQLSGVLESVGGRCVAVDGAVELGGALRTLAAEVAAQTIRCEIPDLLPDAAREPVASPCDHAALDLLVAPGELAVAENGAVWVTDASVDERSALFLAQHVALVVPAAAIVDNMHQAYERIDAAATSYGVFISGPSKTADIEQALVIGAHGPRSLTVYLRS